MIVPKKIDYDQIKSLNNHDYYVLKQGSDIPKPQSFKEEHKTGGGRKPTKVMKELASKIKVGQYIDFPSRNKATSFWKLLKKANMVARTRTIEINNIYRCWRIR
jgi:hypothetical protein